MFPEAEEPIAPEYSIWWNCAVIAAVTGLLIAALLLWAVWRALNP